MAKSEKNWIVMGGGPGETAHCTRCGEGLKINLPQPVDVMLAAMRAFEKLHSRCKGTHIEPVPKSLHAWANGRDTGISSLTIYSAITGEPVNRMDIPYDPADFGRCYRLLKAFPELRMKLHRVADACPEWAPFVAAWDELTALYEEELPSGNAPKLYERMKQLRGVPQ